ncbi:MAG: transcription elongation factor GreA [Planctomycetota bacterium]
MPDTVPMTTEGYARLQGEMETLEAERPRIKAAIEAARALGDLRENADYHAAREELAMLNAKISDIGDKLSRAVVVDTSKAPEGKAVLGSTVRIRRVRDGRELTRTLVGAGEADVSSGKILTTSPIGAALIGHEAGETVAAELPKGAEEFEILEIT